MYQISPMHNLRGKCKINIYKMNQNRDKEIQTLNCVHFILESFKNKFVVLKMKDILPVCDRGYQIGSWSSMVTIDLKNVHV